MSKELDHFRGRTDAKLEYAKLTLQELCAYERRGSGDNFERAHHEAFLFHLLGAEDALLQELNVQYGCALPLKDVNRAKLSKIVGTLGYKNAALDELDALHRNDASWLSEAKSYRNHSTHRQHIARAFFVGGDNERMVRFRVPESGQEMGTDVLDAFADWAKSMGQLVEKGRR
jgi:hypothetical protein